MPRLKHAADLRTVLWTLIAAGLVAVQYANPALVPYLAWFSAYFALSCGIIAHNHNHCPIFDSKRANEAFGAWISIFYGYPTFAWVPTHNLNHHRFTNREGDATATWRWTNKHHLGMAVSYFFMSAYWQGFLINDFIKRARVKNRPLYKRIIRQYLVWGGAHLAMMTLGVALYGAKQGILLWVCTMGLPAFFSLWTIMLFNYDQHVHTDAHSRYDHSRSFTSPVLNFLLFNNGYHLAHHEQPRLHWTELPQLHAELAPHVHPDLNQKSLWWYWCKQYFLAPFFPSLGTKQMGSHPSLRPEAVPAQQKLAV